jgi:hypothetical protein
MQTAVEVCQFIQLSQWVPTFGFRNNSLLPIVDLAGKCLGHHEFCSWFLGYTLNGHCCGAEEHSYISWLQSGRTKYYGLWQRSDCMYPAGTNELMENLLGLLSGLNR